MESNQKKGDEQMTSEVNVVFKTRTLPRKYQVPETEISVGASSSIQDLTQILTSLMLDEDRLAEDEELGLDDE